MSVRYRRDQRSKPILHHEGHEAHEGSENCISNFFFVSFVSFVMTRIVFTQQLASDPKMYGLRDSKSKRKDLSMKRISSALILVFLLPAFVSAQERIKFPVGVSSKVLGYGHLWAAWRLKYFEREGLDVDVVLMRGTAPAVQAMIANSISAGLLANERPSAAEEQ